MTKVALAPCNRAVRRIGLRSFTTVMRNAEMRWNRRESTATDLLIVVNEYP